MKKARGEERRLTRLSKICLRLPEACRTAYGRHVRFHVGERTFGYYLDDHHGDGIVAFTCKVDVGENEELVALDPRRFYIPAYIGSKGWIAIRLDVREVDWDEIAELAVESYRLVAPKKLAAQARTQEVRPRR
jgi:predicted DNA-binding protein (MmcQ/YjbR family)